MKQYIKIISSYLIGIVATSLAAEFFFFNGAHPECAVNDSVGPCEFIPRVSEYVYFASVILLPFFAAHLLYIFMKSKKSRS